MSDALRVKYERRDVRESQTGKTTRYVLFGGNAFMAVTLGAVIWNLGPFEPWVVVLLLAPAVTLFAILGTHSSRLAALRTGPVAIATVTEHVPVSSKYGTSMSARLACSVEGQEHTTVFPLHPLPPVGTEVPVVYFRNNPRRLEPLEHRRDFDVTPLG